jgi:hypothetical protein
MRKAARIMPFLFIIAMFLLHLALPERTYSKDEHRYLTQWPVFHMAGITDGSFMVKTEAYFSDQFPFRNLWIQIQKTLREYF